MKRSISAILLTAIFLMGAAFPAAASDIHVVLDGRELSFEQPPVIVNDRTMVPMRAIFEALGADVTWDEEDRSAAGVKMGVFVQFTIDKQEMIKNSIQIPLDAAAMLINGYTMLPVRAVAESFGVEVQWDAQTRTVILNDQNTLTEFVASDGTQIGGEIQNGVLHGYGSKILSDGRGIQMGYWENGVLQKGYVEESYSNGDQYVGRIEQNNYNGHGVYYFADGDFYIGEFADGIMHGEGIAYLTETDTFYRVTYSHGEVVDASELLEEDSDVRTDYDYNYGYNGGGAMILPVWVKFPLHLYSNDGETYLGKLVTNQYDKDSFMNEYGAYGSTYSRTSIWNEYSHYGSQYGRESAFNPYASEPPVIVDDNFRIVGYLTENEYDSDGISLLELMLILQFYNQ